MCYTRSKGRMTTVVNMDGCIAGSSVLRAAIASLMFGCVCCEGSSRFTDRDLLRTLLDRYRTYDPRHVRPSPPDVPVTVHVYPSIIRINGIDEKSGILKSRISLSMSWTDDLLTWDPSVNNNITRIHVPPESHWLPDIAVHNSVIESSHPQTDRGTLLMYTGTITTVVFLDVQSFCELDLRSYPQDTQTCSITLASWMYSSKYLEMVFWNQDKYSMVVKTWEEPVGETGTNDTPDSRSGTNPNWELVGKTGTGSIQQVTYSCCPEEPFDQVTVTLTLKRRHMSITCMFKWHLLLLLLIVPSQFVLPYTAAIRTIYGLLIVVGLILGLPSLYTFLPHEMASMPTLGQVYITGIFSSVIAVIFSALIVSIETRQSRRNNPPRWAIQVSGKLQRVFCMAPARTQDTTSPTSEPTAENGRNTGRNGQHIPSDEIELHKNSDENVGEMMPCIRRQQLTDTQICKEWQTIASVLDRLCLFVFVIVLIVHAAVTV